MTAESPLIERATNRFGTWDLVLAVFLWQASLGIFFLSLTQQYLRQELGASAAFPGYALALYSLARFLWQTPAGWLADRFGRRLLLSVGIGTGIPILALMMALPDRHLFLVFSGLYGLAAATMWPALLAHIGDTSEPDRRGQALHFLNLAQLLGLGAGTMVGVFLGDLVSYTAVFLACLAFNLLALAAAVRQGQAPVAPLSPTEETGRSSLSGLRLMLTPGVLILGAIILFLSLGIAVQTPAIGTYTSQVLHAEMHQMAFLLVLPASVGAVIALKSSHISDRFGRQVPLIIGLAVTALSLFALTLTRSPFVAVNLAVLAGLAYAISVPAWCAAAIDATQVHCRGLLLGAFAAVQGLGGAAGQAAGGKVSEMYGPLAPFNFAAILLGVAILLTVVYFRHQHWQRRALARTACASDI